VAQELDIFRRTGANVGARKFGRFLAPHVVLLKRKNVRQEGNFPTGCNLGVGGNCLPTLPPLPERHWSQCLSGYTV